MQSTKRKTDEIGREGNENRKVVRREPATPEFTTLLRNGLNNDGGLLRSHSEDGEELLPLQYQMQAIKQLLSPSAKRFMLAAHAPGSGKTVLGALTHAALHVLHGKSTKIVYAVPTPILGQWSQTLLEWLKLKPSELLQVATSSDVTDDTIANAKAVVVSHGIITTLFAKDRPKSSPEILPEPDHVSALFRQTLTMLVVDEAHLARNTSTVLCAALERLASTAKYRMALSGSPIVNSCSDLAGINCVMAGPAQYRAPAFWGRKAAVSEEALESFQPHLHRVSEDELGLPDLNASDRLFDLELTTAQACEYNSQLAQLRSIARRIAQEKAGSNDASVALAVLARLQQYLVSFELARMGASSVPTATLAGAASENLASHRALVATLSEVFTRSNRVCLFACHTSILHVAQSVVEASDLGARVIHFVGGLSSRVRDERMRNFRESTGRVVMMLTIGAGGLGLHIGNAASHVVFWGSIGFTPAARCQAIRRLLRMGQTAEVYAYDVYAKHTVEDGIRGIHSIKSAITSAVVDRDFAPLQEVNSERLLRIVDCLLPVNEATGCIDPPKQDQTEFDTVSAPLGNLEPCGFAESAHNL